MPNEPLRSDTRLDTRTADEALRLAIRLQQQGGERVSLDQLQKTADEAGIDREYLSEALSRIQSGDQRTTHEVSRARRMVLTMLAGGILAGLIVSSRGHVTMIAPMVAGCTAACAAVFFRRNRLH